MRHTTGVHLVDAAFMTSACVEFRPEPRIHNRGPFLCGGEIPGKAENVGIVVDARFCSELDIGNDCRLNPGKAVGGHGHPNSGGAAKDPEILSPSRNRTGHDGGVVGIVDGVFGETSHVFDIVTAALEMADDGFFQFKTTVIGADDESGFLHVFCR
jgi:hypothetical protein